MKINLSIKHGFCYFHETYKFLCPLLDLKACTQFKFNEFGLTISRKIFSNSQRTKWLLQCNKKSNFVHCDLMQTQNLDSLLTWFRTCMSQKTTHHQWMAVISYRGIIKLNMSNQQIFLNLVPYKISKNKWIFSSANIKEYS